MTETILYEKLLAIERRPACATCDWDHAAAERGEDRPDKEADHGCDCLRYFCISTAPRQVDLIRMRGL